MKIMKSILNSSYVAGKLIPMISFILLAAMTPNNLIQKSGSIQQITKKKPIISIQVSIDAQDNIVCTEPEVDQDSPVTWSSPVCISHTVCPLTSSKSPRIRRHAYRHQSLA